MPSFDVTLTAICIILSTWLTTIIIIILACGLHNHPYIKPRDVQLKIPAFINYHTFGYN